MALALSGFAALGMEILWFRHFSIMLGAFRAVFSLLLTVILVGIGAGALIAAALQRRVNESGALLIAMQSLFVVFTLVGMWRRRFERHRPHGLKCRQRAFGAATAIDAARVTDRVERALVQPAADASRSRACRRC